MRGTHTGAPGDTREPRPVSTHTTPRRARTTGLQQTTRPDLRKLLCRFLRRSESRKKDKREVEETITFEVQRVRALDRLWGERTKSQQQPPSACTFRSMSPRDPDYVKCCVAGDCEVRDEKEVLVRETF